MNEWDQFSLRGTKYALKKKKKLSRSAVYCIQNMGMWLLELWFECFRRRRRKKRVGGGGVAEYKKEHRQIYSKNEVIERGSWILIWKIGCQKKHLKGVCSPRFQRQSNLTKKKGPSAWYPLRKRPSKVLYFFIFFSDNVYLTVTILVKNKSGASPHLLSFFLEAPPISRGPTSSTGNVYITSENVVNDNEHAKFLLP